MTEGLYEMQHRFDMALIFANADYLFNSRSIMPNDAVASELMRRPRAWNTLSTETGKDANDEHVYTITYPPKINYSCYHTCEHK